MLLIFSYSCNTGAVTHRPSQDLLGLFSICRTPRRVGGRGSTQLCTPHLTSPNPHLTSCNLIYPHLTCRTQLACRLVHCSAQRLPSFVQNPAAPLQKGLLTVRTKTQPIRLWLPDPMSLDAYSEQSLLQGFCWVLDQNWSVLGRTLCNLAWGNSTPW